MFDAQLMHSSILLSIDRAEEQPILEPLATDQRRRDRRWYARATARRAVVRRSRTRPAATGHRVWNAHPVGSADGSGMSPSSTIRRLRRAATGSGSGTAESRDWVYGWAGAV